MNFKNVLKVFGYKHEITLGDIVQILLAIVAIAWGVGYISAQIRELKPGEVPELIEGESYKFDKYSSITIVAIDPEGKEVKARFYINGNQIDNILIKGKAMIIPVSPERKYAFMLIDIGTRKGHKTAKFVFAKVKE